MDDWKKRAAILAAFGFVFGVFIFAVKSIGSGRPDELPVTEPPKASAEKKERAIDSKSAAPAAAVAEPAAEPSPSNSRPPRLEAPQIPSRTPQRSRPRLPETAEAVYELFGANVSRPAAFQALFRTPGREPGGEMDRGKIGKSVRDYIARYRPHLELSDSDYERLTDMVVRYRGSANEMRSNQGTGGTASTRGLHLEEMQGAMSEFRSMTDTQPEDLFGIEASNPPPFGE